VNLMRGVRRVLLGVFAVAVICWSAAAVAAAHAVLVGADPAYGVMVDAAPQRVSVTFDEAVTAAGTGVTVTDQDGRRVDTGPVGSAAGGRTVQVAVRSGLPTGTYLISWVVLSADGHTVGGSSVFGVGEPPDLLSSATAPARDPMAVAADGVVRMLTAVVYFGVVLVVGIPLAAARIRRAWSRTPVVAQLIRAGAVTVAIGSLLIVVLDPVRLAGLGGWADAGLWGRTIDSDSALPQWVRALAALAVWWVCRRTVPFTGTIRTSRTATASRRLLPGLSGQAARVPSRGIGPRRGSPVVLWAGAVGIVLATAASGHAVAGNDRWVAVVSTAVHVGAMAVWVAALVLTVLVWRGRERMALLPNVTGVATVAVVALAVTGGYQVWRSVDPPAALWSTPWGRLLLVKVAVVVVALAAVLAARTVLRRWATALFTVEFGCQMVILVVTAVLAGTAPARDAYDPRVASTVAVGPLRADVVVDRAGVGGRSSPCGCATDPGRRRGRRR
jgi:copper transport protein